MTVLLRGQRRKVSTFGVKFETFIPDRQTVKKIRRKTRSAWTPTIIRVNSYRIAITNSDEEIAEYTA